MTRFHEGFKVADDGRSGKRMATRKRRLPFAIETLRHYQKIQFVSMEETEKSVSLTLTLLLSLCLKGISL